VSGVLTMVDATSAPLQLLGLYLVLPLILTVLSLGRGRDRAVGVRKFFASGLAVLAPAAPAAAVGVAAGPLTVAITAAVVVGAVSIPAARCFLAARALQRGDVAAAQRAARRNAWLAAGPAVLLLAVFVLLTAPTRGGAYGVGVVVAFLIAIFYTAPAVVGGL